MPENRIIYFADLSDFSEMFDAGKFEKISQQLPPTDPRIKELLSNALMSPEKLSPAEVQQMAASIVYHLLAERKADER